MPGHTRKTRSLWDVFLPLRAPKLVKQEKSGKTSLFKCPCQADFTRSRVRLLLLWTLLSRVPHCNNSSFCKEVVDLLRQSTFRMPVGGFSREGERGSWICFGLFCLLIGIWRCMIQRWKRVPTQGYIRHIIYIYIKQDVESPSGAWSCWQPTGDALYSRSPPSGVIRTPIHAVAHFLPGLWGAIRTRARRHWWTL